MARADAQRPAPPPPPPPRQSRVRTPRGRQRAWIRTAINDGSLESFLALMCDADAARLRGDWYLPTALVGDRERMLLLAAIVAGLEPLRVVVSCNDPLLDTALSSALPSRLAADAVLIAAGAQTAAARRPPQPDVAAAVLAATSDSAAACYTIASVSRPAAGGRHAPAPNVALLATDADDPDAILRTLERTAAVEASAATAAAAARANRSGSQRLALAGADAGVVPAATDGAVAGADASADAGADAGDGTAVRDAVRRAYVRHRAVALTTRPDGCCTDAAQQEQLLVQVRRPRRPAAGTVVAAARRAPSSTATKPRASASGPAIPPAPTADRAADDASPTAPAASVIAATAPAVPTRAQLSCATSAPLASLRSVFDALLSDPSQRTATAADAVSADAAAQTPVPVRADNDPADHLPTGGAAVLSARPANAAPSTSPAARNDADETMPDPGRVHGPSDASARAASPGLLVDRNGQVGLVEKSPAATLQRASLDAVTGATAAAAVPSSEMPPHAPLDEQRTLRAHRAERPDTLSPDADPSSSVQARAWRTAPLVHAVAAPAASDTTDLRAPRRAASVAPG